MLKYQLIILRYHLGTVAFGSLLLALIQLMRVAVEYINDRWDLISWWYIVKLYWCPTCLSPGSTMWPHKTSWSRGLSGFFELASSSLKSSSVISTGLLNFQPEIMFLIRKYGEKKTFNRNAYIMTAMVGSNFCKASQDAFTLITSNILRGFFVNQVVFFQIEIK